MNRPPKTTPSFRSRLLWFLAWAALMAVIVLYLLPLSVGLLTSPAAILGMLVGVGVALLLIFRRGSMTLSPILWGSSAVVGIGLFVMFRALVTQIEMLTLPAYFSPLWVLYPSALLAGLLLGVGAPLVCYGVVTAGYRLLE